MRNKKNSDKLESCIGVYLTKEQRDFVDKVSSSSEQSRASYIRDLIEYERESGSTPIFSGETFETPWGRAKRWLTALFF